MLNPNIVIIGALLNLIGISVYVYQTVKGRIQPNRVTWFIWALAPLLAFSAELGKGVGIQSLMTFMVGFGPLLVFIASFVNKKSVWRLTRLDLTCGALSLLGLALWAISGDGNVAILFAIGADALAAVPTIVKAYKKPESESYWVFLLGAISAGLTLLTIDSWTLAHYGFPLYILLVCLLISSLSKFKLSHLLQTT